MLQDFEKHLPIVGDINSKSPLAYQTTRGAVEIINSLQMTFAEAYINGLEVPDFVLQSLFDTFMPIFFRYFPSLLAPYESINTFFSTGVTGIMMPFLAITKTSKLLKDGILMVIITQRILLTS